MEDRDEKGKRGKVKMIQKSMHRKSRINLILIGSTIILLALLIPFWVNWTLAGYNIFWSIVPWALI